MLDLIVISMQKKIGNYLFFSFVFTSLNMKTKLNVLLEINNKKS